jgi:hypothetical protein
MIINKKNKVNIIFFALAINSINCSVDNHLSEKPLINNELTLSEKPLINNDVLKNYRPYPYQNQNRIPKIRIFYTYQNQNSELNAYADAKCIGFFKSKPKYKVTIEGIDYLLFYNTDILLYKLYNYSWILTNYFKLENSYSINKTLDVLSYLNGKTFSPPFEVPFFYNSNLLIKIRINRITNTIN